MWGLLIFAGLCAVLMFGSVYWARKRRRELDGLARALGLRFAPEGLATLAGELSEFHLCSSGHNRKVQNCLYGSVQDIEVSVFEYRYDTGGSSPTTYHHAVACVRLPANLPAFRLSPTDIFHKIGNLFGYRDINFDTHPVFSRNCHLVGVNEAAIRKAFTPPVLDFCENQPKLHVEGKGARLIVYRNGFLKAKDASELLRIALHFSELFRE